MRPPISHDVTEDFIKKGTWSPEEDYLLVEYIRRYGIWNWTEMPKAAGVKRSGKSCRLRWMNYLRPNIRRGNYSKEEEDIILKLHEKLGNKWSAITARLPGRTDNDVKNYWHTHLKKRIKTNQYEWKTKMSMQDIKLDPKTQQFDVSPQKEQEPAFCSSIPVASDPGLSCLTDGSTSSSSESWFPPRDLRNDRVNEFLAESFLLTDDNLCSSYVDYSLWFEEPATYSYASNEEHARDIWGGLFMHLN